MKKILSLLFLLLFMQGISHAQQLERYEIISAYIYNFAKNIQWQDEEQISKFHFKVISKDNKIIKEFNKLAANKMLKGKAIKITAEEALTEIEHVQLIYISKDKKKNLVEIFDRIEGKNILLVSEAYDDKRIIMINFYETKDKTVQFEINKANIINQGLTVLSDMVLLGGTEVDVAEIYRESQQSLRGLQKQLENLQQRQKDLQGRVEAGNIKIEQQQQLIEFQTASIDSQKNKLEVKKIELRNLFAEITRTHNTLNQKTQIITTREKEIEEQKKEVEKGVLKLSEQLGIMYQQNAEIDKQEKILKIQGITISTQQNILYLLGLIILLILILIFSIYKSYQKNKKAKKKISEQKSTLEKTLKQLQNANKELEAFSYSVSHDLRAPLRAIDGFSEILSDEYKDKLDEEAKRLINIIRKNTMNMNQLITDLLDFSRLGRQQVKTVKINIKNLARVVYEDLRQLYPKREIKFKLEEIPSATGDINLIRLVFTNLISNAIKFSRHKKVPEIEIGFKKKEGNAFYYVKDNGVGFEMKYVDKIFEVFKRLHTSEEFEGTGVGLAIVQKIIYKHGGKVVAEAKVNKGATFYFSLQKE